MNLTTGHGSLNYHQSLLNPGLKDRCRLCGEEKETFYHFFIQCPRLMETRTDILRIRESTDISGWKPSQILRFISETILGEIFTEAEADGEETDRSIESGSNSSNN